MHLCCRPLDPPQGGGAQRQHHAAAGQQRAGQPDHHGGLLPGEANSQQRASPRGAAPSAYIQTWQQLARGSVLGLGDALEQCCRDFPGSVEWLLRPNTQQTTVAKGTSDSSPAAAAGTAGVVVLHVHMPLDDATPVPAALLPAVHTHTISSLCCPLPPPPPSSRLPSTLQIQMKAAPVCVKNSTWLTAINGTLSNMLYPRNGEALGTVRAVLCQRLCR